MVDLNAAVLVRAGSGLLWLGLGIAVLGLARDLRGRLLGAVATGFGAHFVLFNLTVFDPATQIIAVTVSPAIYGLVGVAALVLTWTLAASRRMRLGVVLLGAFAIAAALAQLVNARLNAAYTPEAAAVYRYTDSLFVFGQCALAALVLAMAGLHRRKPGPGPALAALAFGIYLGFASVQGVMGHFVTVGDIALQERGPALYVYWGSSLLLGIAAAIAWLAAIQPPEGRRARDVALLLLLSATLGAVLAAIDGFDPHQVSVGVLRTFGAALFAAALFRYGLFDLRLPRLVASKGTLAAGALATLFIVAQVMQNFLSAEYGLLTGGVIAGAVLFAASPIQKRIERVGERSKSPASSPHSAGNDDAYRAAVRVALRDRRLTRDEEVALADVAERLGIGPKRAVEILRDVEREKGVA